MVGQRAQTADMLEHARTNEFVRGQWGCVCGRRTFMAGVTALAAADGASEGEVASRDGGPQIVSFEVLVPHPARDEGPSRTSA